MGRILEVLKQAEAKRIRPVDTVPGSRPSPPAASKTLKDAEPEPSPKDAGETEIPFIEVGGPHSAIEGSPSVMAASPKRNPKSEAPRAPAKSEPTPVVQPAKVEVVETGSVTVAFRPFPVEPPPLPPAPQRFAPELVTFHRPDHSVSEQYRSLLKALMAQMATGRPQVLLLSAAAPGAGTTTALLNLAITAAQSPKLRVVVVDAAARRPAIAKRLGLPLAPGLHDVLMGTTSLQRALQETGQLNLHALTAGEGDGSSGARFVGEAMRSVLRHLRSRFDLTLVDTLPWDGRPDVVALGSYCDSVYLAVRQADAQKPEITELLQLIPQQGSRLRGCILTQR